MENFNGNLGINIMEIIIKMKDRDMEQWSGQMEVNLKVTGFMEFNMELALCFFRMEQKELVFLKITSSIYP